MSVNTLIHEARLVSCLETLEALQGLELELLQLIDYDKERLQLLVSQNIIHISGVLLVLLKNKATFIREEDIGESQTLHMCIVLLLPTFCI